MEHNTGSLHHRGPGRAAGPGSCFRMDPIFAALRVDVERTRRGLPPGLDCLADVAWNLAWSWLPDGLAFFEELDPRLWAESGHNARGVLEGLSPERRAAVTADPAWTARAGALAEGLREYLGSARSPQAHRLEERYGGRPVAYFSAEFGLHESLPIYSGGLGLLAGDHLKAASDLGLPLLGVGLRYRQGYFRQGLDLSGWQTESYSDLDFHHLPSGLILQEDGTPRTVQVPIRGRTVTLQLWAVQVGRVPLLLLDSNRDDNEESDRWITAHLYGGDRQTRLAQEMVLGIGGVRALRLLGYDPAVFHMNEGHAALLSLELVRERLEHGEPWDTALHNSRERTVFTTHTPVPAGHDRFHPDQVREFLGGYLAAFEGHVDSPAEHLLALGREQPENHHEEFNMTHLALRASRSSNGVSRLHGAVSRHMFHWLWPGRSEEETPISHVTNGVHLATWMAPSLRSLLDRYLGEHWDRRQSEPDTWAAVDAIPDAELWAVHCALKRRLVESARRRARRAREERGESPEFVAAADALFDPDALTLGFARRVATYKRLGLLLQDRERALRLLDRPGQPVQFLLAGKAHPNDSDAKRLLQSVLSVRSDPRVLHRAVFLVEYDAGLAREMVQGSDVWLNLPRRPLEASGTSGMKAALNGVLNCSVLDGWWAEGYNGGNGWAVGEARDYDDPGQQDRDDAASLYRVLEEEVIPLYFDRDADGIPRGWVARMKECLKSLGPVFTTHRMVEEYAGRIYAP